MFGPSELGIGRDQGIGVGFGAHGEGYFRLSVTAPDARIEEAMERMRKLKL